MKSVIGLADNEPSNNLRLIGEEIGIVGISCLEIKEESIKQSVEPESSKASKSIVKLFSPELSE